MAEGGGLLNRYRGLNPYRGFESPSLRHRQHSVGNAANKRLIFEPGKRLGLTGRAFFPYAAFALFGSRAACSSAARNCSMSSGVSFFPSPRVT